MSGPSCPRTTRGLSQNGSQNGFSLSLSSDSFHTPLRRGVCVHPDTKLRVLKGVVAGSRVCHQRRHSGYLVMHGLINRVYLQFVTSCNIFAVYW